jgi:16S rRNA (uracil1498-N3)-methyltransferase
MSSVPRFHVPLLRAVPGYQLALPAEVARQVGTVLRMRMGERVAVFNDGGPEWEAELVEVGRGGATARLVAPASARGAPAREVTLCQALLKGEKMEWVLQKGTELGVAAFQPLLTERVIARKAEAPERWRRILVEAAEQCGRVTIPRLLPPVTLEEALRGGGRPLLCWEDERALTLVAALRDTPTGPVRLIVGPEGGFAPHEVEAARAAGVRVVSLGPLILRAETASIAASTLALLTP